MTVAPPHVRGSVAPGLLPRGPQGSRVTAVVVTRGDTEYLEETLAAVAAQTRPPQQLLVVDVAEDPGALPADLVPALVSAGPPDPARAQVVHAPRERTFGDGVRAGLTHLDTAVREDHEDPSPEWLWLLHDDSAPEPTALAELLRTVELAPSVAIAGSKQRTWDGERRVVQVGVSTSRFGRRTTGIDQPEVDQGQHDGQEDVLAVGLAGALVRRDVWDHLGGTDPALGPSGDGLDLCRRARLAGHRVVAVPSAVVRHAQASLARPWSGAVLHRPGWDATRSHRRRREAYLHTQLVGVPLPLVPVVVVLAVVSSLVRAAGRLVAKDPHLVTAELAAPWFVLARPLRVVRARRAASRTRAVSRRALRPLQTPWREVQRQVRDRRSRRAELRRVERAPSELELRELAALRARRRGALTGVALVLVVGAAAALGPLVAAVAGGMRLRGGTLPEAATGLRTLWDGAWAGWVPSSLGHPGPVDPTALALVPLVAVTGSTAAATTLLLLAAVPLAGLGAWAAAGAGTRSVGVRAWVALVWAAAPALLVAQADGRWGAVLAHVALPWVVLGVARGVGAARRDAVVPAAAQERATGPDLDAGSSSVARPPGDAGDPGRARRPASLGALAGGALALALVVAGAPSLLPAAVVGTVVLGLAAPRRRLLWLPVPMLALQAPILARAAATGDVRLILADPGVPVAAPPAGPEAVLGWLPDPVTVWGLPVWAAAVAGGVLAVVALGGLARGGLAVRPARVGWALAAVGGATAVVVSRVPVAAAPDGAAVTGWAGPGTSLALAGLLVAAVAAADGFRTTLVRRRFGIAQPAAAVLAVAAVLVPLALAGSWGALVRQDLDVPEGERRLLSLRADDVPVVPAAGLQLQRSPDAARIAVLDAEGPDRARVRLLREDGSSIADVSRTAAARSLEGALLTPEPREPDLARVELADVTAHLVAGVGEDTAPRLARLGVGAVVVPPARDGTSRTEVARLHAALDATAGLERVTETTAGVLWRVAGPEPAAWARTVDGETVAPLAADGSVVQDRVGPGGEGRVVVLAERADVGWRATLDGRPLRAVDLDWRQAFELGAGSGELRVTHTAPDAAAWRVVQALVLAVTVLLAVPVPRRQGGAR